MPCYEFCEFLLFAEDHSDVLQSAIDLTFSQVELSMENGAWKVYPTAHGDAVYQPSCDNDPFYCRDLFAKQIQDPRAKEAVVSHLDTLKRGCDKELCS